MANKVKKVDPKMTAKTALMATVANALRDAGMEVLDGAEYGMTKGTLIVRTEATDIQLKPITPKTGITRYEVGEEA